MRQRHYFSKDECEFLKKEVPGKSDKAVIELFYKRFGVRLSNNQLQNKKTKLNIKSGIFGGRFEKGQTPFNKGKKWSEFMSEEGRQNSLKTTFKKGHAPHNHRPVGSERVSVDGYVEVKVEEPKKWKCKHTHIWEQAYGKVPKGHVVIFADSNRRNFSLDNLVLASRAELARLNQSNLITDDAELTKSGIIVARLLNQIGKRTRS